MKCPHCAEQVELLPLIKAALTSRLPAAIQAWLQAREWAAHQKRTATAEAKDLRRLMQLYAPDIIQAAHLTDREQYICAHRLASYSREELAVSLNVTSERVRQIEAKALRKLEAASKVDPHLKSKLK